MLTPLGKYSDFRWFRLNIRILIIFSVGPSFVVNAKAVATLELEVDITLGLAHNITNGRLLFPALNQSNNAVNCTSGDTLKPLDTVFKFGGQS